MRLSTPHIFARCGLARQLFERPAGKQVCCRPTRQLGEHRDGEIRLVGSLIGKEAAIVYTLPLAVGLAGFPGGRSPPSSACCINVIMVTMNRT